MVLITRRTAVLATATATIMAVITSIIFLLIFIVETIRVYEPDGAGFFSLPAPPVEEVIGFNPVPSLIIILLASASAWGYLWYTREEVAVNEH